MPYDSEGEDDPVVSEGIHPFAIPLKNCSTEIQSREGYKGHNGLGVHLLPNQLKTVLKLGIGVRTLS